MKKFILVAASVVVAAFSTNAQAALMTYNNRAAFEADAMAHGPLATESFELGNAAGNSSAFTHLTASRPSFNIFNDNSGVFTNSPVSSGSLALTTLLNNSAQTLTFDFTQVTRSVGFEASVEAFTTRTLTFTLSNGDMFSQVFNGASNPQFFGMISDSVFTSLTIQTSHSGWVGFDAVTVNSVPEPASALVFGLVGCCAFMRRRRA